MASPQMTLDLEAIASASITASANINSGNDAVNLSAKLEGQFQVEVTFGTVAATNGLRVEAFRAIDVAVAATFDTIAFLTFVIPGTTSTAKKVPFTLPTGLYKIVLTNIDATNGLTLCRVGYATVDGLV